MKKINTQEKLFPDKMLPIGIQTFADIIQDNFLYVDKTRHVAQLTRSPKGFYFLSRPRRFGKTLFLDTLRALFAGEKDLFKGLYIHDKWDWSIKYPVIHLTFTEGVLKTNQAFRDKLEELMKDNSTRLGVHCEYDLTDRRCFKELIRKAHQKFGQKVVVLVDEYDKPILDNISDPETARLMRDNLRDLYSVIKGADEHLRFVFLTGVSKFSKVSVFSGLNNLEDVSLDASYATICGYTQNDIQTVFAEHLQGVDMARLQKWYNGYNFLGDSVYNPFDILLFISKECVYQSYWFSTGTPTFLMQLLDDEKYYLPNLEKVVLDQLALDSFDIGKMPLEVVLFQTGYLTIKEVILKREEQFYRLGFPNFEVQSAFNAHVIGYLTNDARQVTHKNDLLDALYDCDSAALERAFVALFAGISYHNYTNNTIQQYEGFYASVLYAYFKSFGEELIAEDTTSRGRIDLTLKINRSIYIFEFKMIEDKSGQHTALQQIKDRQYADKYRGQGDIYLIGLEFSRKERNLITFEWEEAAEK